jgi:hypothetical protein
MKNTNALPILILIFSLSSCEIVSEQMSSNASDGDISAVSATKVGHDSIYVALDADLSRYPVWFSEYHQEEERYNLANYDYRYRLLSPTLSDFIRVHSDLKIIERFQLSPSQFEPHQIVDDSNFVRTTIAFSALSSLKPETLKFRFDGKVFYRLDRLRKNISPSQPSDAYSNQHKMILGNFVHYEWHHPCPAPADSIGPICLAMPSWRAKLKLSILGLQNSSETPGKMGISTQLTNLEDDSSVEIDADRSEMWGTVMRVSSADLPKFFPSVAGQFLERQRYYLQVILLDKKLYFKLYEDLRTTY